jgi:hypothetical protein
VPCRCGAGQLSPWLAGTTFISRPGIMASAMTDICSARGCQQPAVWALRWNNPKLHTPERRKVWLACEEHKQSLSDFLGARGFLKEVVEHVEGADESA